MVLGKFVTASEKFVWVSCNIIGLLPNRLSPTIPGLRQARDLLRNAFLIIYRDFLIKFANDLRPNVTEH